MMSILSTLVKNMPLSRQHAEGIAIGCTLVVSLYYFNKLFNKRKVDDHHATSKKKEQFFAGADDSFQSLYYGPESYSGSEGAGFPLLSDTSFVNKDVLTTIHNEYKLLPKDTYKFAVEHLPIVCVDVVFQRHDGKLLLFYRKDKPAAKIWWWPGGRMFRGETFEAAAVRKIRDETGNKLLKVKAVGIINVWNTFFPDSNWDSDRQPGREGTQTVNISVFCRVEDSNPSEEPLSGAGEEDIAVLSGSGSSWAVQSHRWVSKEEVLGNPNLFDKYVTLNVQQSASLGFL